MGGDGTQLGGGPPHGELQPAAAMDVHPSVVARGTSISVGIVIIIAVVIVVVEELKVLNDRVALGGGHSIGRAVRALDVRSVNRTARLRRGRLATKGRGMARPIALDQSGAQRRHTLDAKEVRSSKRVLHGREVGADEVAKRPMRRQRPAQQLGTAVEG